MTDIQGALGVAQMKRLIDVLEGRRAVAAFYDEALADVGGLVLPTEPPGHRHGYQSYVTLVAEPGRRDEIALRLQAEGIATRQGTHAVHALGYYRDKYGLHPEDQPRAWTADRQSLTLPVYADMTRQEQEYVVERVRAALG
jgi:dTDP-4-amino-4,6-dideoxygalactose transaminase